LGFSRLIYQVLSEQ